MQLLKSITANDIDAMEKLGIYEVAPEDFALCEYACFENRGAIDCSQRIGHAEERIGIR